MRKCLAIMTVLAMAAAANAATINWGYYSGDATGASAWMFEADGTTPVATGYLMELVYIGGDGVVGTGDDAVWATSTVGFGTTKAGVAGEGYRAGTAYLFDTDFTTGDAFAIRFYNTADASGLAGYVGWDGIDATTANTWAITAIAATGTDTFNTGIAGTTSTVAVPEPGTIALAIAGLGAVIARRRKNRK